jgi:hypothetical protein
MATVTTFVRARPIESSQAGAARDLTPYALGALGTIVVTEDASADGGASVVVTEDAYSWSGVYGVALDPRTQRPFRRAPWLPVAYPDDLAGLLGGDPLAAYITTTETAYAGLLGALAATLGAWGWTSTEETD